MLGGFGVVLAGGDDEAGVGAGAGGDELVIEVGKTCRFGDGICGFADFRQLGAEGFGGYLFRGGTAVEFRGTGKLGDSFFFHYRYFGVDDGELRGGAGGGSKMTGELRTDGVDAFERIIMIADHFIVHGFLMWELVSQLTFIVMR